MRTGAVLAAAALAGTVLTGCTSAADHPENTIRIATADPVGNLNPWDYLGQFHAMDLVYEPLVAYGDGGELEPALATGWDVSDDGLTVTFDLREGVTFHDGTAFDADAAKWNLEHWIGQEEFSFLRTSEVVTSIDAPADHTLVLTLSEPYPALLNELTIVRPVRFLSPASAPDGEYVEPVGTGPWTYESSTDTTGTFLRNDDYWGTKPTLERVEMRVIPDSQTRLSALRSGEVDLVGGGYLSPMNAVEAATAGSDSSLTLHTGEADTTMMLVFNVDGPAADPAVREAISLATDVESVNQALYGGKDHVAHGFFPPSVPYSGTPTDHVYDIDQAARVLDDAGWVLDGDVRTRDGERLVLDLLLTSDPVHGLMDSRTTGQALQDSLAGIGVVLEQKVVDQAAYFDEKNAGDYDLAFATTYGAPYDPTNTVTSALLSSDDTPVWSSPELDALVTAAVSSSDPDETEAAYQAVYDYLAAQVAFVAITSPPRYYATSARVTGFTVPPHEYHLDLTEVTVR